MYSPRPDAGPPSATSARVAVALAARASGIGEHPGGSVKSAAGAVGERSAVRRDAGAFGSDEEDRRAMVVLCFGLPRD